MLKTKLNRTEPNGTLNTIVVEAAVTVTVAVTLRKSEIPFPLENTHVNKSIQVSKFMGESKSNATQCKSKSKHNTTSYRKS